jgi:CBS domain-containing protein
MNDRSVGGVLVVDDSGSLLGIFTERDILRRVVAAGLAPDTTKVSEVFTRDVVTTTPTTSIEECGALMSSRRVRHLPVVDATGLHGVVTIGDLLAHQVSEHETTLQQLYSYVFDRR